MACDSPGSVVASHWRTVLLVTCMLWRAQPVLAFYSSEGGCDWEDSGLHRNGGGASSDDVRRVVPVYLRCDQGAVTWHYPRGALRVVLRHGTSGRDFRACVRISANSTGGAVHLEGHRKLLPLYQGPGDKDNVEDVVRCFGSYNGQAALFLEATAASGGHLRKDAVRLWYHLTPVSSQRELLKDDAECRPCTDQELLHLYCSSDFVVEGRVSGLRHLERREVTEISVRATRVHRREVGQETGSSGPHFKLERPLKCGTRAGSGRFLFLGQRVLGRSTLRCAPRLDHWRRLRRTAIRKGTAACALG